MTENFFITGVSRGLGRALFSQLIAQGKKPAGIGRHFTPVQRQAEASGACRLVFCDLASVQEVEALAFATLLDAKATAPAGFTNTRAGF